MTFAVVILAAGPATRSPSLLAPFDPWTTTDKPTTAIVGCA